MRSIGNKGLGQAGEGIQQTSAFAGIDTEFFRNVFGDRAYGDDGYRVIGGAEVTKTDDGGDASFGSAASANSACEFVNDVSDASVETDHFQHSSSHESDDDEFSHIGNAFAHGVDPNQGHA